jgi:putative nucleotidyltransferase with HDIG domain
MSAHNPRHRDEASSEKPARIARTSVDRAFRAASGSRNVVGMAATLKLAPAAHTVTAPARPRPRRAPIVIEPADIATHIERYLPVALLATALVAVAPVLLSATLVRSHHPLSLILAGALAMALSVAFASLGAAVWKRRPGSCDVVFADLMLWNWLRRCWKERRLGQARALYESARDAGPSVSIGLLERLSTLLEVRDAYTEGHSRRVARHAGRIAEAMRLSATESAKVRTAAAVHDIGKLYTPRSILTGTQSLTDAQFRVLKRHPSDGADMLAEVGDPDIAAIVRHHHERIDGHGYPDGLAGEAIPLGARIVAVADTFDAITSNRAYRSARTHKHALDVLSREAGSQLDGAVVAAFVQSYTKRRPLAWLSFSSAVSERLLTWLPTSAPSLGVSAGGAVPLLPALGAAGVIALAHVPAPARLATGPHDHVAKVASRRAFTRQASPSLASASEPLHRAAARSVSRRAGHEGTSNVPVASPSAVASSAVSASPASASSSASTPVVVSVLGTGTSSASGADAPTSSQEGSSRAKTPSAASPAAPAAPEVPSQSDGGSPVAHVPTPSVPSAGPSASTPSVSVPSTEVSVSAPVIHVTVTTPEVKVPAVEVPAIEVPAVKVPAVKLPAVTLP